MSLRNIRKVYGGTELPPPGESSDEEYEPSYAQKFSKNVYAGLEVSSDSEGNASEEAIPEQPKPDASKKKKRKKKKKQCKPKDELDEIDRSVKEVNALLGEPQQPLQVVPEKDLEKVQKNLFTVRQQFLEVNKELDRMFGPDEDEEPKKRGRQPNLRIIAQKGFIIPTDKVYKKSGLTMVLKERKDGLAYFVFEHSKNYQNLHTTFLYAHNQNLTEGAPRVMFPLEESQRSMHVEGLLELADRLYIMEEYTQGNKVIEEIISYMQQCSHPFFSITDRRTRLEYKHVENRAFHIALMKYMHMLTNKACHRTALELAKLMLNLDPADPLAILFIIDTIAIRAREYQWIIEAIDFWNEDRDAGFLFNMQYSYALAHFHIAKKNKEGFEKANELLQQAILRFPTVVTNILQNAGIRNAKIKDCPLFIADANDGTSSNLKDLIFLYARFIWHKFCEESVMKWLINNATAVVDKYETDVITQGLAKAYANMRMNLFQTYPPEIIRHLSILTPLNNLVVDGAVPKIEKVVSYDPAPPFDGINMYDRLGVNGDDSVNYFEIFTSILPEHELQDASMEYGRDLLPGSPLLPDEAPLLQNRIFSDDSESETDSDDDSDDSSHNNLVNVMTYRGPATTEALRLFVDLYDNVFVRVPIENISQDSPALNDDSSSSSDDDDTSDRTNNMIEGSFIFTVPHTTSDSDNGSIDDSDDDSDPVIATLPIRNAAQFYRDLAEKVVPIDLIEGAEPIEISPEIDFDRVRRGHFSEDHAYDAKDSCIAISVTKNEINFNIIPQEVQHENVDNQIEKIASENQKTNDQSDDEVKSESYFEKEKNESRELVDQVEKQFSQGQLQSQNSDFNESIEGSDDVTGQDDENDNGGGPDDGDGENRNNSNDDGAEENGRNDDGDGDDNDGNDHNEGGERGDGDDRADDDDDDDDGRSSSSSNFDAEFFRTNLIHSLQEDAYTEYRRSVIETRVPNGIVHHHRFRFLLPYVSAQSSNSYQQGRVVPQSSQPSTSAGGTFPPESEDDVE